LLIFKEKFIANDELVGYISIRVFAHVMEENHRSNVVEDSKENALAIYQLCICIMHIEPCTCLLRIVVTHCS
jgi:hypothetical protein